MISPAEETNFVIDSGASMNQMGVQQFIHRFIVGRKFDETL